MRPRRGLHRAMIALINKDRKKHIIITYLIRMHAFITFKTISVNYSKFLSSPLPPKMKREGGQFAKGGGDI